MNPVLVDCDVHNTAASPAVFAAYLPARWARHHERFGLRVPPEMAYYATPPRAASARSDSWPREGGPPGSSLDFMREQLLDRWQITHAILNPAEEINFGMQLGEYAGALTRAINDWTAAEWLEPEPRLRSSLCVAYEEPDLAVAEIERLGSDPRFVQVLVNARTRDPLGRRKYWPIYEAAAAHGLPVAMHVGGFGHFTGTGWPSFYFEIHAGHAQCLQAQVISLVTEGVFERFPDLRMVMVEGGFGWLPPLMWRMDRAVARFAEEVPHLERLPSETIREHLFFTSQPIEEPEHDAFLPQLLDQLDMSGQIMFATDYPHWDFDAPDQALPRGIEPDLRQAILSENAMRLYRFGDG
jgi:predicted TIM-barrel fold metal-dependent hydrolase